MTKHEARAKWVKALRSGEYSQGRYSLKIDDDYCCLGVLCDISGLGRWEPDKHVPDQYQYVVDGGSMGKVHVPLEVGRTVGLTYSSGMFYGGALSNQNDMGMPFEKIADLIESEPEGLFLSEPLN